MTPTDQMKYAFTPVGKLSEKQKMCMLKLENAFKDIGAEVLDMVPNCADRTHALRLLLDVKFWCTQAITHEKEGTNAQTKAPQGEDPRLKALEDKLNALQAAFDKATSEGQPVPQNQTQG